jgi:acetyl-CoA carboxylase biotin carboxyl carrier protein
VNPTDDDRIQQVTKEAKELIKLLDRTNVRRLSLDGGDFKIEIERSFQKGGAVAAVMPVGMGAAPAAAPGKHRVLAPLSGTFYLAAKPGAKPFVEVGARVQRGQTIGIIDVMKTMNEVPSDAAGVVVEIVAGDRREVRENDPLIVIDTAAS